MKTSPYDVLWSNPAHWKWRLFYCCKADPRVIVPKRPKWMGRTLNFAHPRAYTVLLATVIAILLPFPLLPHLDRGLWMALIAGDLAAILVFYYRCELRVRP